MLFCPGFEETHAKLLISKIGSLCLNLNNQGGSTTNDMDRMQSFQKGPHVSNKYD